MKRIFIPFFATAALLASCSDWTEVEHRDLLPQMNQSDPVFLASLRDFKAGEHLVTMMIRNLTLGARRMSYSTYHFQIGSGM